MLQYHLRALHRRWEVLDDEVWAKLVVMEKAERAAKAYIKTPVLSVDGADTGFDGRSVGLSGLESGPAGDKESAMVKLLIEEGCRLKLTQNGDILIKRDDNLNMFAFRSKHSQHSTSDIILKQPYGLLQKDKTYKLFDMKKFQEHLSQELLTENPDWSELEKQVYFHLQIQMADFANFKQTVSIFTFAKFTEDVLEAPVWIVLINVVALHVIKTLRSSI